MRRGVIVDRDGTLIDVVRDAELGVVLPAFHPSQVVLLPGVLEGLARLRDAGFALAMATNQPGVAKGQVPRGAVERTNDEVVRQLEAAGIRLAGVEVCWHHPEGGPGGDPSLVGPCSCRKPAPGMLERLVRAHTLDPGRTWMIGDSLADVGAARAAGVGSALVFAPGRCELCPFRVGTCPSHDALADIVAPRFDAAAAAIVARVEQLEPPG